MTSADMVDAALARADKALESREVSDLAMAAEVLRGMLDWAAKAERCETLVSDVLRTVTDELRVQRGEE